jgi:hypothetical protein
MASFWEDHLLRLNEKMMKKIQELAEKDSFEISGKKYARKKITVLQNQELEDMRADFASMKNADARAAAKALIAIYCKGAQYYLGMGEQDFYASPWEEIKAIVDACSYRTVYGSAFL